MSEALIIIGHRGACGYAPENTLKSFAKAIECEVDMVELDVHVCKSGELVVIHDKTVDRTTNGIGEVADKTLSELKELDAGEGEQIPTLQEVFDFIDRQHIKINIELKGEATTEPTAQIIEQYVQEKGWQYDDFLISSFDHFKVQKFKQLCPQVKTGAILIGVPVDAAFVQKAQAQVAVMAMHYLTKNFVEDAHARGKKVFTFIINNPKELKDAKNMGVDGIFSDYPEIAQRAE